MIRLTSCERAEWPDDARIRETIAWLERGDPYPHVVAPRTLHARSDAARTIAALLRRLVE